MERRSLPPSLSWQESATGNLRENYYGDASGGEAELGVVATSGAAVRLISKTSYGTSTLKHHRDYSCSQSPGLSMSSTFPHNHTSSFYLIVTSPEDLDSVCYTPDPHISLLTSFHLSPPNPIHPLYSPTLEGTGKYLFLHILTSELSNDEQFRQ